MLYKEIFANEQSGNCKKVIDALGGRENVNSVAHCATRLRVMVKDEEKINKEVIENLEKFKVLSLTQGNTKLSLVQVQLTKCTMKLLYLAYQHHLRMT